MRLHTETFERILIGKMGLEIHFRQIRATILKIRYTKKNVHVLWKK